MKLHFAPLNLPSFLSYYNSITKNTLSYKSRGEQWEYRETSQREKVWFINKTKQEQQKQCTKKKKSFRQESNLQSYRTLHVKSALRLLCHMAT